jgi:hypothetical protein
VKLPKSLQKMVRRKKHPLLMSSLLKALMSSCLRLTKLMLQLFSRKRHLLNRALLLAQEKA